MIGNDDDSLDGEGGGGIDEADDEDRIPEELLLKYANEAGLEKGRVSTLTLARVLLKPGYPSILSSFCAFVLSKFLMNCNLSSVIFFQSRRATGT